MPRYTDEQLIDSLRRAADQLGHTPTMAEFRSLDGFPDILTVTRRLGSWKRALGQAGLKSKREVKSPAYTDDELLEHLRRSAKILGKAPCEDGLATIEGFLNAVTYCKRFGSWKGALAQAGIGRRGRKPQYSDDELLDILKHVTDRLGRPPTSSELALMDNVPSAATYANRFGSWTSALDRAGIKGKKTGRGRKRYTDEKLLSLLNDAAGQLGRTPRVQDLSGMEGFPSPLTYRNRFGSWVAALKKAGLKPTTRGGRARYTPEELLDLLKKAANKLGRAPRSSELADIKGLPTYNTYIGRFGTWQNALLAAGLIDGKRGMTLLTAEQRCVIAALDGAPKQLAEIAADGNIAPDDAKAALKALAKRGIVTKVKGKGKKGRGPPRFATVDEKLNEVLAREAKVSKKSFAEDGDGDSKPDAIAKLIERKANS